jgi:hypothetical protein
LSGKIIINEPQDKRLGQFNPIDDGVDLYTVMDRFKLALFLMNVILTVAIVLFFETKPSEYPTLS